MVRHSSCERVSLRTIRGGAIRTTHLLSDFLHQQKRGPNSKLRECYRSRPPGSGPVGPFAPQNRWSLEQECSRTKSSHRALRGRFRGAGRQRRVRPSVRTQKKFVWSPPHTRE